MLPRLSDADWEKQNVWQRKLACMDNFDGLTTGIVSAIMQLAPRTVSKLFDGEKLNGYRTPVTEDAPGNGDRRISVIDLINFLKKHDLPYKEYERKEVYLGDQDPPEDLRKVCFGENGLPENLDEILHCRDTMELVGAIQEYAVPIIAIESNKKNLIDIIKNGCKKNGYLVPDIRIYSANGDGDEAKSE